MTDARVDRDGRLTLEIEPLDVLFCGGGRSLEPACRVESSTPTPQVLAGALRTWLLERTGADLALLGRAMRRGADFASATAEQGGEVARVGKVGFRGPWFAKDGERVVQVPTTVQRVDDGDSPLVERPALCRFDPLATDVVAPGWSAELAGMRPLWRRSAAPSRPCRGFLRSPGLQRFLDGEPPPADELLKEASVYVRESRHGIGVNSRTNTAEESLIYQIDVLRLARGVRLEVDLVGSSADLAICPEAETTIALGGEGRRAIVRRRSRARTWPRGDPANGDGRLILLTTPGLFDGWRPPGLDLVAASVRGNLPVSGWDLARGGPKRTRFAVPAGSVYFLAPGSAPPPGDSLCPGDDGQAGWGAFVEGEWNHA